MVLILSTCRRIGRSSNTGTRLTCNTRSATLPKSRLPRPLRPCVAMTIASAPHSLAHWIIASAGSPTRTLVCTDTFALCRLSAMPSR
jgi:hypothetical protein